MTETFVGRDRPLRTAAEAIDRAARGHGSAILVTGEAGIGKTRLAREVADIARDRGIDVVWAAAWPAGGAPPYWPWPEVLDAVAPSSAPLLERDAYAAERERFDRFRDVAQLLWQRAADAGPLLVVIDDVQAVDADGLLLTRFVAQGAPRHPVLLLLTQRTAPAMATNELLEHLGRSGTTIRLDELDHEEIAAFLASHGEVADAAVVQRVAELTGGVPFLVEVVLDAGLHRRAGPVPDPVRRQARTRLDALDDDDRAVVEAAAVLGPPLSPATLAPVADRDPAVVVEACRRAADLGLLVAIGPTTFAFPHELAREAVVASVDPDDVAVLHRRCLAALAGAPASAERANRQAHHAVELARTSAVEVDDAVETLRASASLLGAHGAPEAAVGWLQVAVDLQERRIDGPVAPLLVALGSALLATGRLTASREVFGRAVEEAVDEDTETFVRAALGLGGVWVMEHRTTEGWSRYLEVLERALGACADDPGLAASVRLRIAAERAAVGAIDVDEVLAAMDAVRATGDPADVVASLSLLHHLMMGPAHAEERVAVADELIERSRALGDDLHLVMGMLWRTADDVLLGNDVDRALAELRARADALGMRAILFIVEAFEIMCQLRAGDLDAAEAAAFECHARGVEVGDADAEAYFAAHLLTAHWYRGTAPALLAVAQATAASSSAPVNNPVFTAVVAALAAEAGDVDAAERAVDAIGADLGSLVVGSTWLATMFCLVEAAHHLDDRDLAARVYDLLLPYERLPTMGAIGVSCFGSTARSLGIAARTAGRLDDAIGHLELAVAENQRLANRPMTAISRANLADALLARGAPGDRGRAAPLLARALDGAHRFGLTGRIGAWSELRARCDAGAAEGPAILELRDGAWFVTCGEEHARLAPSAGLGHLARLLESPGVEIPVGELVGGDIVTAPQDLLDPTAKEQLRRRIADLESGLDAAALRDDHAETARLQAELDELMAHLKAALGPAGRSRRFDDSSERARTSVQKALRRAITAIGAGCPQLAEALATSVRTGYRCCYEPTAGAPAKWEVRRG